MMDDLIINKYPETWLNSLYRGGPKTQTVHYRTGHEFLRSQSKGHYSYMEYGICTVLKESTQ